MILVTGGAGYIGTHVCVELLAAGHGVVVLDNLVNSRRESLARVERITRRSVPFVQGDVRDRKGLERVLREHSCSAVIHLAGVKAVGDSVADPLAYYDNNVAGSLALLQAMQDARVRRLVFSSSATVYGEPHFLPFTEDHPLAPTSPYGRTKLVTEHMLQDLAGSEAGWCISILRYFNPVGAHRSGLIGEDPAGVPNNLMPFIAQVACGRRPSLNVWGADYPTADGTGVRDYIHVVDLAKGHVRALAALTTPGCVALNLGTGVGYSVLEVIRAFERVSGCPVPFEIAARRPGDLASYFSDPALAGRLLGWKADLGLDDMCADTWRWQSNNPAGYG